VTEGNFLTAPGSRSGSLKKTRLLAVGTQARRSLLDAVIAKEWSRWARKDPVNRPKRGARSRRRRRRLCEEFSEAMTTLEQRNSLLARGLPPPREEHVFAADGGRRARLTRLAGLGAAALSLVWLTALGAAMLGAERLPGVSPPSVKQVRRVFDAATPKESPFVEPPAARPVVRTAAPRLERFDSQRLSTQAGRMRRAGTQVASPSTPAPAGPPPAAHPAPLAPAPAQAPSPPQRGWARRGWAAPPGQAKRDESVPRGHPHSTGTPATPNTIATSKQGAKKSPKKG
jgi:hypothetical protein